MVQRLTICLVVLAAVIPLHAGEPAGRRVFSAGHSFHVFVPGILGEMAKSAGIREHTQLGVQSIGGSWVYQHWNVPDEKNTVKAALRTGKVDVLTLSPIYLPDDGIENFSKLAGEHNPNTRVLLQTFWLPYDVYAVDYQKKTPPAVDRNSRTVEELRSMSAEYFQSIDDLVRSVNAKLGRSTLGVVPAGQASILLREKIIAGMAPGLSKQEELFTDPIGHVTPPLAVLTAYCHYAVIYGRSPVGLPMPSLLKKNPAWREPLNTLLQELAWEAVTKHPLSGVVTSRDPPTTHDPNLYLFVDDRWIAEKNGLKRIVNRAKSLPEPVVWPDDPATEADFAWGNVIREPDGRFRMWYGTMMMGQQGLGPHDMARAGVWGRGEDFTFKPRSPADVREVETMLGRYAESHDGIHWVKPKLGLIEFRGNRDNNILLNGERAAKQTDGMLTNFDGYTILRDDREPDPNKRYKMVAHWETVHCWDNHEVSGSLGRAKPLMDRYWAARGEYITHSPDGLRWEQPLVRLDMPTNGGDRLLVVPDHRHSRWMAYVRSGGWAYPALSYSPDLIAWSPPEGAKTITPGTVQAPAVECMIPFNYGNQDLAFPCGMDKPRGIFTPMLASRHDGADWTWVDNTAPFLPPGEPGTYNATGVVPLHNEPFVVGDEMLLYFNSFSRNQKTPSKFGTRTIGVARLRRDGFAGVTAEPDKTGMLVTPPIAVTGSSLLANVEQRAAGGSVTLALLDESGAELPGFGFADAEPVTKDATRAAASWKGAKGLDTLAGQKVRLSFRLQGSAVLYAFAFSGQ